MADKFSKKKRSDIMARIKSKHTKPELFLKKRLKGFQYHPKNIFGSPDFMNYQKKIAVFVDGCFWHGCPLHYREPKSRRAYWIPKIERNQARDKEVDIAYKDAGWKAIRIWEHELKNDSASSKKAHAIAH